MARFITLSSGVSRIRFKEGEGAVYFEKGRKGDSEIMACRNHNRRGRGGVGFREMTAIRRILSKRG